MKQPISLPKYVYTHVDKHGRIVIPADIRAALGLEPGEEVSLEVNDGRLEIQNVTRAIRESRGIARRLGNIDPSRSIVDEFIAERRAEAERE